MKNLRHFVLILLFAALVTLEVVHGMSRLEGLSRRQREGALDSVRRGQEELARRFEEQLRAEREHARYLVKMPGVRALLETRPGSTEEADLHQRLERDLSPYLLSFPVIDRLALHDARGRERFRMTRLVSGLGSLPPGLLGEAGPSAGAAAKALETAGPDGVVLSELEIERDRIEVPENDRQVLRYAARVAEGTRGQGVVVLTLYAFPLLEAVRIWEPLPGIVSALVDAEGRYLAHPDRRREVPASPGSGLPSASLAAALLAGGREVREGGSTFLATPVEGGLPGWRLVAEVPEVALSASVLPLRGEYRWVIGSMTATTLLLVAAAWFILHLSVREVRLAEAGRYLERVRREAARYRVLMEKAADMILIVAPGSGLVREANGMARSALGLGGAERLLEELVSPSQRTLLREKLAAAAQGAVQDLPEIRLQAAQGREIPASGRLAAIDLGDERVLEVALRDLTREKEMERQVRIAERLGSLGLLTAGVAHEINNPLEGIENYLTLLERVGLEREGPEGGGDPARRARFLEMVRYGFRRIRDIVRDLSSFARPQVKGARADLAQVVERALSLARYDRGLRGVQVERRGLERPLEVLGDEGRLEQVFLNLFLNAARAMKGSGRLHIAAAREERGASAGPEVEVRVEDSGPGIPEELLGRIFDPFFTTGEGTGLGLSISYGIVRACGGELRAENRPEGGARFSLRLPAPSSSPPAAASTQQEGQALPGEAGGVSAGRAQAARSEA